MKTREYRLGELAKFSNGINFDKDAYFGNGIRLITVSDFGNNFSPDYESLIEVSNEVVKEKDLISKNDILFVRSNGNKELVGRCMLIDNVDKPTTYSGFCIKCHFDNENVSDPKYFTYYFKNQYFRKCISNASGGTNIQNLNQEILSKHRVQLPPLPTQQKIASILSAYDNLIQNYKKQIEALQTAASELYKEWFVRFRFPGYQTAEFENGIPKGWKIVLASELGEFIRGKNITAEEMQEGMIPVISAGIEPSGFHNQSNVKGVSLTISNSGANAGYLQINYSDIWAADCSYCNSAKHIYFYYELLNNMRVVLFNLQKGAAQPHVYAKDINKMKILLPPSELIETANNKIKLMHEKIYSLQQQVTNLTQQRDLLLPRLMSGKLEVK